MSMLNANRKTKVQTPSVGSVAGALVTLREIIKEEHGIDVDIKINIHGWPSTPRLATLAIKDMTNGAEGWKTEVRSVPNAYIGKDGNRTLTFFCVSGLGINKGLEVTIYKTDGEKVRRPTSIPKPTKKHSNVTRAIFSIRSLIRDLYGVDAGVNIQAKVEVSKYTFIPSINPHVSKEAAVRFLSSVAEGTDWKHGDTQHRYSESYGSHCLQLLGNQTEIEIRFPLDPEERKVSESE